MRKDLLSVSVINTVREIISNYNTKMVEAPDKRAQIYQFDIQQ